MRGSWFAVTVVAFAGCESMRSPPPPVVEPPSVAARPPAPVPLPATLPEIVPVAASTTPGAHAPGSPRAAPEPDHLSLAAECLQRNDRAAAAVHLEAYVRAHPEQILFRAQLGELLVRVGRDDAARVHYERFAADARAATGPARDHLVQAHTRLMEIARRAGDRFGEAFHRGAGLLLLVKEQDKDPQRDEGFCEEMLCQALRALGEARDSDPADPRVRLLLAEAHDRAGNRRAAENERAAARNGFAPSEAPPGTPAARRHTRAGRD